MTAPPWLDVLDATVDACARHGRADLAATLRRRRGQLLSPQRRVVVVGEPNQGKSMLVNALLNASVCAVGDHVTTPAPIVIEHAKAPTAALVRGTERREPIAVEDVASHVVAHGTTLSPELAELSRTEVGIPRTLLAAGLVLVDTPSADLDSLRAPAVFTAVADADAVIVVSAATRELSASELALVREVAQLCPTVVVAPTKIDIAPRWRRIAERDRARLASAGVSAPVIPVSATLRLAAAGTDDHSLNAESGFADLVAFLRDEVVGAGEALAARSVAAMAGLALRQLVAALHAALAAEPATPSGALARWQESQTRMDALRRDTIAWQTGLVDDITDLISDIEYDLRDRTRQILREVDRFFDQADPATAWRGFADWLDDQLIEAAETNFAWLVDRFDWITDRISRDLAEYRDAVLPRSLAEVDERDLDGPVPVGEPLIERFSAGQKAFTGLRGSYGGVLMFGLVTSLAGWPLINAVSVGAGALFAAKSIHDEADLRRKRRQAGAKLTAQRHVDDFFLGFSKDTKDVVRQVQRRLRDHLAVTAEQLRQVILASAESAKQAVDHDAADAQRRVADARAEVTRLGQLQLRAGALAADHVRMPRPRRRVAS